MNKHFLLYAFFVLSLFSGCTASKKNAVAQEETVTKMLDSLHFVFSANLALPMNGMSIPLSYGYNVRFTGDSVIAYLPYFGRAYEAPLDPQESGIRFISTKFKIKDKKLLHSGVRLIGIEIPDAGQWRQLYLSVSLSRYATLQVNSNSRQSISFYGELYNLTGYR